LIALVVVQTVGRLGITHLDGDIYDRREDGKRWPGRRWYSAVPWRYRSHGGGASWRSVGRFADHVRGIKRGGLLISNLAAIMCSLGLGDISDDASNDHWWVPAFPAERENQAVAAMLATHAAMAFAVGDKQDLLTRWATDHLRYVDFISK
jgi:hypothetical protein